MRAERHIVMGSGGSALVSACAVALIAAGPDAAATRACEALLFGPGTADEIVEQLASAGDDPPAFALALGGQAATSVVVSGAAWARIGESAEVRHDPADEAQWTAIEVDDDSEIVLLLNSDDTPTGQWLTTGVIGAGAVAVGRLQAPRSVRKAPISTVFGDVDFGNLIRSMPADPTPEGPPIDRSAAVAVTERVPIVAADSDRGATDTVRSDSTAPYVATSGVEPIGEVVVGDGRVVQLDAPILIGRRPPPDPIAGQAPHIVVVDDPMLSRHHVTLRVADGRLVVIDEHSTNGTSVMIIGHASLSCSPGQPVEVPLGATIDVGGALTVIHRPVARPPVTPHRGSTAC